MVPKVKRWSDRVKGLTTGDMFEARFDRRTGTLAAIVIGTAWFAFVGGQIIAGGKLNPEGPSGSRQGINDYTGFMADNPELKGDYFGYDGPCPPWNDEIVHHYHFVLYATDLDHCPVEGRFTGTDVLSAIDGHILGEARITGTYALNPDLRDA